MHEHLLTIWLAFALGLVVRWGDRIQYVVSQDPDHTVVGYVRHNYLRLALRVISNAAVFHYLVMPTGWIVAAPIAFSIGLSFDTLAESALDRAKSQGEVLLQKVKGSAPAQDSQTPPSKEP